MKYLVYYWFGDIRVAEITQELEHSYVLNGNRIFRRDAGVITTADSYQAAPAIVKTIEPYNQCYKDMQRAADETCRRTCEQAKEVRDNAILQAISALNQPQANPIA